MKIKKTSYFDAVYYFGNSYILCDNIPANDSDYFEGLARLFDDDEDAEIYQTFLSDCSDEQVFYLRARFGLHFAYHSALGLWVLLVTHSGTSWDSVECYDNGIAPESVYAF